MPTNKPLLLELGEGMSLMLGAPTIASWDTKNRPQKPKPGTLGFNTQTSSLEYWDGDGWLEAPLS